MKTVVYCTPEQFCTCQKETGGEYGVPLTFYCMAEKCVSPSKQCLFVMQGGKRP